MGAGTKEPHTRPEQTGGGVAIDLYSYRNILLSMTTYVKKFDTHSPLYQWGPICNSCNGEIPLMSDHSAWAVYLSKTDTRKNQPYDVYCSEDVKSWIGRGALVITDLATLS